MIKRSTWVFLAVFVVLLGAAVYWQRNGKSSSAEATSTPQAVFLSGVESQLLSTLKIESAQGQTVALKRDESGTWMLTEPQAGPADPGPVEANVSQLLTMRVITSLEAGSPLGDLGLTQPQYTITLGLSDGSQKIVRVGKETPTGSGYYAQIDGGPVQVVTKFAMEQVVGMAANPPLPPTPTGQAPEATQNTPAGTHSPEAGTPPSGAAP